MHARPIVIMLARPSAKEGVEFICKVLRTYGIDYLEAEDFRKAKDDDMSVTSMFKNLCADILAILITECRHPLVQPRDYDDIDSALSEGCQLIGTPLPSPMSSRAHLALSLLFLSHCGTNFIDGYRDLALGEAGFNSRFPRVDTYRSKAINRASAEQAAAAGSRLSKIKDIAPCHVLQVLTRRDSMKAQLEDLEAETLKLAKKQGIHVGEWLAKTERKGGDYEEKLAEVEMEAIGELAFWVWAESINVNLRMTPPEPQKPVIRKRTSQKTADLRAAELSVQSCLDIIKSRGLHVRPNNQFLSN